ncbi:hypothetical protein ABK040_002823 [Willaertia magna]
MIGHSDFQEDEHEVFMKHFMNCSCCNGSKHIHKHNHDSSIMNNNYNNNNSSTITIENTKQLDNYHPYDSYLDCILEEDMTIEEKRIYLSKDYITTRIQSALRGFCMRIEFNVELQRIQIFQALVKSNKCNNYIWRQLLLEREKSEIEEEKNTIIISDIMDTEEEETDLRLVIDDDVMEYEENNEIQINNEEEQLPSDVEVDQEEETHLNIDTNEIVERELITDDDLGEMIQYLDTNDFNDKVYNEKSEENNKPFSSPFILERNIFFDINLKIKENNQEEEIIIIEEEQLVNTMSDKVEASLIGDHENVKETILQTLVEYSTLSITIDLLSNVDFIFSSTNEKWREDNEGLLNVNQIDTNQLFIYESDEAKENLEIKPTESMSVFGAYSTNITDIEFILSTAKRKVNEYTNRLEFSTFYDLHFTFNTKGDNLMEIENCLNNSIIIQEDEKEILNLQSIIRRWLTISTLRNVCLKNSKLTLITPSKEEPFNVDTKTIKELKDIDITFNKQSNYFETYHIIDQYNDVSILFSQKIEVTAVTIPISTNSEQISEEENTSEESENSTSEEEEPVKLKIYPLKKKRKQLHKSTFHKKTKTTEPEIEDDIEGNNKGEEKTKHLQQVNSSNSSSSSLYKPSSSKLIEIERAIQRNNQNFYSLTENDDLEKDKRNKNNKTEVEEMEEESKTEKITVKRKRTIPVFKPPVKNMKTTSTGFENTAKIVFIKTELSEEEQEELKNLKEKLSELEEEHKQLNDEFEKKQTLANEHIKKLHEYNEMKDIGQMLLGQLAHLDNTTVAKLYEKFGLELED